MTRLLHVDLLTVCSMREKVDALENLKKKDVCSSCQGANNLILVCVDGWRSNIEIYIVQLQNHQ